ncbi:hypothetical protein KSP39_PZI021243 [Platanthera zijinensis]|uniref:Uncharacterized protein n=1 Tax=Platanthera zijinensis TaxID=2320716 RepID=A0AAP0AXV7_9ASPA
MVVERALLPLGCKPLLLHPAEAPINQRDFRAHTNRLRRPLHRLLRLVLLVVELNPQNHVTVLPLSIPDWKPSNGRRPCPQSSLASSPASSPPPPRGWKPHLLQIQHSLNPFLSSLPAFNLSFTPISSPLEGKTLNCPNSVRNFPP